MQGTWEVSACDIRSAGFRTVPSTTERKARYKELPRRLTLLVRRTPRPIKTRTCHRAGHLLRLSDTVATAVAVAVLGREAVRDAKTSSLRGHELGHALTRNATVAMHRRRAVAQHSAEVQKRHGG